MLAKKEQDVMYHDYKIVLYALIPRERDSTTMENYSSKEERLRQRKERGEG